MRNWYDCQLDNYPKTLPKNNQTSYTIVMVLELYPFLYTKTTTLQATFPISADKDFDSFLSFRSFTRIVRRL